MARLLPAACLALLLAACASGPPPASGDSSDGSRSGDSGGGYYQNDGPPDDENIDLGSIPDAVPKDEPPSRYGNPDSYSALGQTYYVMPSAAGFTQTGLASWYGRQFHGRRTSSGEPYNMYKMTAAHKRLPVPSYVRVTNRDNNKQVIVRVNDRGPFHDGRIIDLSYVAARRLGIVAHGSAPVRIETVTPASLRAERESQDSTPASRNRQVRRPVAPTKPDPQPSRASASRGTSSAPPSRARAIPVAGSRDTAAKTGDLFLQSGAFSESPNADALRARLHNAGFTRVVIAEPSSATPFYRVRVGPYRSAGARRQAHQKLTNHGFAARNVRR